MRYLILAQSETTARALGAWMELLGERPLTLNEEGGDIDDERVVWSRELSGSGGRFVAEFRRVAGSLKASLEPQVSGGVVVLVDSLHVDDLSAVGSPSGWNRLIALLILAFPEIRWVFGCLSGVDAEALSSLEVNYGLASLFGPDYDPVFDGTGLRDVVRKTTVDTGANKEIAPWIPRRKEWAAAIDDESVYAYLHAYVAYRHGFRAFAVHSQELADHLLKPPAGKAVGPCGHPYLTLEDHYLAFPDRTGSTPSLSNLKERADHWCLLKGGVSKGGAEIPLRYFVTSGHRRGAGKAAAENARFRLTELVPQDRGGREALKPVPGIFALWDGLGLKKMPLEKGVWKRTGLAPGFVWPYKFKANKGDEDASGHSSPGLLLLVAEHLVARGEELLESVRDVKDAVRGAVLATSALELLGTKTPTTAREAVELKHRFEVLAECQFGGIQYNLQLDDRFAEIQREMAELGQWYGRKARDAAVLSGELTILSRLIRTFRDHEEFDEEEICRRRIRTLQRKIWWRQHRCNPISWIVLPVRAYIEFLLGSNTRFTGAIIGWIGGLTLTFKLLEQLALPDERDSSIWGFSQALSFFFGTEALNSSHPAWVFFTVLAIISGFVHLGVFISQLYATVARR